MHPQKAAQISYVIYIKVKVLEVKEMISHENLGLLKENEEVEEKRFRVGTIVLAVMTLKITYLKNWTTLQSKNRGSSYLQRLFT